MSFISNSMCIHIHIRRGTAEMGGAFNASLHSTDAVYTCLLLYPNAGSICDGAYFLGGDRNEHPAASLITFPWAAPATPSMPECLNPDPVLCIWLLTCHAACSMCENCQVILLLLTV